MVERWAGAGAMTGGFNALYAGLAALALCGCAGPAKPKARQAEGRARTAVVVTDIPAECAPDSTAAAGRHDGAAPEIPFERGDTLFFCDYSHCDSATGFRDFCRVYVDRNRLSANYGSMRDAASLDSERNRRDFGELAAALQEKYPGEIRRFDLHGCPGVWQQLASVAGGYYIDDRTPYPVWITDSLFVEQTQEGPWPSLIESFEKPADGRYTFRTRTLQGEERRFDLCIVDTLRGVGVLVEHESAQERYRLLAAGAASPHFDLLVWESAEMPSGYEIHYDDIDFEALTAGMF